MCDHDLTVPDGPTTCAANPAVLRNIKQQIKANRALSRADVRLASAMGLVSANSRRPLGMGDGVFYPVDEVVAPRRMGLERGLRPTRSLARREVPSKLHALCLLVDFEDNRGRRPAAEFQRLLFDTTNPDSMTSYYTRLSGGAIDVGGEVVGYVRAPHPYAYYTDGQSGLSERYPNDTRGLVVDALSELCKTDDLTRFDTDGDGYVDGLFLVHAGGGAEAEPDPSKRPHMIWSHKWTLPEPFEDGGVKVFAYSTEPEDGRVGVFAHEFGHVLGLPDLYDSSYRSQGIGDWCLMASGSWGGNGNRPTRMSAWCMAELGWITPKVVTSATPQRLPAIEESPDACRKVWCGPASGPEYFLLENRQRAGMDREIPGSGLLVWHVDERQATNDDAQHYRVALVQADGARDLEHNTNSGDTGDPFPGTARVTRINDRTTPSTRGNSGQPSGVEFSGISMKDGVVTVTVSRVASKGGGKKRRGKKPARRTATRRVRHVGLPAAGSRPARSRPLAAQGARTRTR